jgi:hypothetical protein
VPLGFLDADSRNGAAAEAFEAQSAGSGEQFEDTRSYNPRAEAVEYRLLYEVRRWPNVQTFRRF